MHAELDLAVLRTAATDLAEAAHSAACDDNIDYTRAQYGLIDALRKFHAATDLFPDIEEWEDR